MLQGIDCHQGQGVAVEVLPWDSSLLVSPHLHHWHEDGEARIKVTIRLNQPSVEWTKARGEGGGREEREGEREERAEEEGEKELWSL